MAIPRNNTTRIAHAAVKAGSVGLLRALFITVLAITLLCAGCTNTPPAPTQEIMAAIPTATPTAAPTPTPTPVPVGSRMNPLRPGEACSITVDTVSGQTVEANITLKQVIRGPEVLQLLLDANQFNPVPAAGKEYLFAEFYVECESIASSGDSPYTISRYDFQYSSESFSLSFLPAVVHPAAYPDLLLTLYAGASGSGWVCFEVDQNEASPYGVYLNSIWFRLSSDTEPAPSAAPELTAFLLQVDRNIRSSLDGMEVSTHFNGETFSVLLTAPDGLADSLAYTPNEMRPFWTEYVENLISYNQSVRDSFVQAGYADIPVTLSLISDADPNDILFSTQNGTVVYNVLQLDGSDTLPTREDLQPITDWLQTAQTKGRYDGKTYQPAEIEDEELQFLAAYFYYAMNGQTAEAVKMFSAEDVTEQYAARGNLDMDAHHPHSLLIKDKNISLIVETPTGEFLGFGVFYNEFTNEFHMLAVN